MTQVFSGFDESKHTFKVYECVTKDGYDVVEYHDGKERVQATLTAANFVGAMCEVARLKRDVLAGSAGLEKEYAAHHEERAKLEKEVDALRRERDDYAKRLAESIKDYEALSKTNANLLYHRQLDAVFIKSLQEQAGKAQSRIADLLDAAGVKVGNMVTEKTPGGNNMYVTAQEYDRWAKDSEKFRTFPAASVRILANIVGSQPYTDKGNAAYSAVKSWMDKHYPVQPQTIEEMRPALHAAGKAKYGDKWDSVRHTLAFAVTGGRTRSTTDLSRSEYERLLKMVQEVE